MQHALILASGSPQRQELLRGLGIPFQVHVSRVEEDEVIEHDPVKRSAMLAKLKAEDVEAMHPGAWVLGCDTLVVAADGTLLEKAQNQADAKEMITKQSGNVSTVHSALCILSPDRKVYEGISSSSVHFKKLSSSEIDWWIGTGLWQGRSGSFQIDGPGQLMIESIHGDWSGIVGLPVFLLGDVLKKAGWDVLSPAS
ncbi:MAG: Maf family protein [Candidatus Peribacteraceae bacterium]|nr:Maf family protein [Candidatus Peribacteraceae bacterium]MDD5074381.1 Maf family protein [Candidatus Peribacteraceae bacterium]